MRLTLNRRQYLELEKLALGVFNPVTGFMDEATFRSVVADMHLPGGELFPLPIVLDVTAEQAQGCHGARQIELYYGDQRVGEMAPESVFTCDKQDVAARVYGTTDVGHAGVASFFKMGSHFVGGAVVLHERVRFEFSDAELTPAQTRAHFAAQGWKTVAGFQTRNVPHLGHEYLLRLALEQCDGLFVQPVVGEKKLGDFTAAAVLTAYRALIKDFLPAERILLGVLSTAMRYAGPREAVFHAIIRRNYGCTHFIVGRDHAGVGNFYGKYAAQDLTRQFNGQLGIQVLCFAGPFYCGRCGGIVTERTCPHEKTFPSAVRQISGTDLRALLSRESSTDLMRREIVQSVAHLPLFITAQEIG